MDLQSLIATLSDRALYPGAPSVEIRQTHASCVFLTPTDAYKLKKPVDFGFLDYSTLRRRGLMCRREVDLNRRLAPSVYLGVERLVMCADGSFRIGGPGKTVEYLVRMRRLPDEATLSSLLARDAVSDEDVERIARTVAAFHAAAPVAPAGFGSTVQLWRNAAENLAEVDRQGPDGFLRAASAEVRSWTRAFLATHGSVLRERVAKGRVRDGHGDLRCEHVYLYDGQLSIVDCVEFNRRHRHVDVGLDLSFLVMDISTIGCPDRAEAMVRSYEAASGDSFGALMDFFCCYRAMVRCKVAFLRSGEPEFDAASRLGAEIEARRYLMAALRFARSDRQPWMILVTGLTGSGKSTAARLLQGALPARVASSDETRKKLAGLGPGQHAAEPYGSGLYSPVMNARVYHALLDEAAYALSRRRSIILDATHRRPEERLAARDLARRYGARFLMVECHAREETIEARLRQRAAAGGDPWSDGTWEVYLAQRDASAPASELEASEQLPLDTEASAVAQVERVLMYLAYAPGQGDRSPVVQSAP